MILSRLNVFIPLLLDQDAVRYVCLIWVTKTVCYSNQTESIQNNVLRYLSYKRNITRQVPSCYEKIICTLNLKILKDTGIYSNTACFLKNY